MIQRIANLYKLIRIVNERGNWKLIRRSSRQLRGFIFCREGMNKKSILGALLFWFHMLKGMDVLIWRLETFGFLYIPAHGKAEKERLNRYL